MKKWLWIYPIFMGIAGVALFVYFKSDISSKSTTIKDLWFSQRPLPSKIAMNAYLKAGEARKNQDLETAIQSYLNVLKMDPENKELMKEVYLLAMVQGRPDLILNETNQIQDAPLVDYLKQAKAYLENAPSLPPLKSTHKVDSLLKPLVQFWHLAKQGKNDAAIKQLNLLPPENRPFLKGYHKVMLGTLLKDNELAMQGIQDIGESNLFSIGYFPLIQKTIQKNGDWKMSALFQKYQELQQKYPVTADLLIQLGQTELDFQKALAESFYIVSTLAGNGTLTRDETIILNSIALALDPQKEIAFVWGAELAEGLELSRVALSYYERLHFHSATLQFKKASVLMLNQKTEEALAILEKLRPTNLENIHLLGLLGQAYLETGKTDAAITTYTQLIPLLEKDLKNKPLANAYLIRASLYHQKNDTQKMLSDFKHALTLDPDNPMLLNDLGYHELESGNISEGFDLVQRAYLKKPKDAYILDSLAFGYLKKNQPQTALSFAEQSLDLMPQSSLINAHLGDIYQALGRKREAQFQYKKALDLNSDLTPSLKTKLTQKIKGETYDL